MLGTEPGIHGVYQKKNNQSERGLEPRHGTLKSKEDDHWGSSDRVVTCEPIWARFGTEARNMVDLKSKEDDRWGFFGS
jgi:hypothetical protein